MKYGKMGICHFRTAIILLLGWCWSMLNLYAAGADTNQIDTKTGKPTGEWISYLNADMQPAKDKFDCKYYKVINYKDGLPDGAVKYYYKSDQIYFSSAMQSVNPDIPVDGEITYYAETGKPDHQLTYKNGKMNGKVLYWDVEGNVIRDGVCKDGAPWGLWREVYADGTKGQGEFLNGNPEGEWNYYFPNGYKSGTGNWSEGKKNGQWVTYSQTGATLQSGWMKDNEKTGNWKEYRDDGGWSQGDYTAGVKTGDWSIYGADSVLVSRGPIKDEKEDGFWIYYFPDGKVKAQGTLHAGSMEGTWRITDENGQSGIGSYLNNLRTGMWKFYNADGKVIEEGAYKDGKEDGSWIQFDSSGTETGSVTFKDGVIEDDGSED